MTGIAFDRCFSAGAYTALDMICRAAERHPDLSLPKVVELLLKTDADSTGLDFAAALHLKAVAGVEHS